ncbi:hypothetical protein SBOR_0730 [Sclerotinia borealis F-4128]|uniref:Uncharacterized protein n=1 Tax=Sclerotinia borealis (strain F-4128) TaxID=1432307 RepID=W9CQ05_SCLBF|nr:hypothetical protein SBOR_0730 [Sclerotinia borealis F-4128]
MSSEKMLQVFEIWAANGDSGIIHEGVLILPCPSPSSHASSTPSSQRPVPYFFHTTRTPSSSSPQSTSPLSSSIGGQSIWQGNILASSLPQYLQICASVTTRHCGLAERELLRKPAEWTKMLFLDLARERIWVESILSMNMDRGLERERERGREGEMQVDGRRRRGEKERPMACDSMMLGRLRRRLDCEVRTLGQRNRGREMRSGNIVEGIRRRRQRRVLRPRGCNDSRETKEKMPKHRD